MKGANDASALGRRKRSKGARGERRAAKWFTGTLGWPAFRTAAQAHTRADTPDVRVTSPAGVCFVEVKETKTLPSKGTLDALAQAESYCQAGEVPVLWMHVAGSSRDVVMMEKAALLRLMGETNDGNGSEVEA